MHGASFSQEPVEGGGTKMAVNPVWRNHAWSLVGVCRLHGGGGGAATPLSEGVKMLGDNSGDTTRI